MKLFLFSILNVIASPKGVAIPFTLRLLRYARNDPKVSKESFSCIRACPPQAGPLPNEPTHFGIASGSRCYTTWATPFGAYKKPLYFLQRLFQVSDDIISVFQPH